MPLTNQQLRAIHAKQRGYPQNEVRSDRRKATLARAGGYTGLVASMVPGLSLIPRKIRSAKNMLGTIGRYADSGEPASSTAISFPKRTFEQIAKADKLAERGATAGERQAGRLGSERLRKSRGITDEQVRRFFAANINRRHTMNAQVPKPGGGVETLRTNAETVDNLKRRIKQVMRMKPKHGNLYAAAGLTALAGGLGYGAYKEHEARDIIRSKMPQRDRAQYDNAAKTRIAGNATTAFSLAPVPVIPQPLKQLGMYGGIGMAYTNKKKMALMERKYGFGKK